ncbi:MAG: low affinity iron permease family protein [Acidobacteriota bacterium]|nr:low affinity iron permease family protein [Acidobacteriota bacterium]
MAKQLIELEKPPAADWFGHFASGTSGWLGSKWGFSGCAFLVIAWAISGPIFHYSDGWQLVANTATNVITFIMVFLIQNTQNRDARAMNLKLDELIRAIDSAGNHMIDIEKLSDIELDTLKAKYEKVKAAGAAREERDGKPAIAG